jgi:TetR/AcrR family transcriptional repressor of nem operon
MGRKPAFDRELVLRKALKAFWWEGYDKTSLEDLLAAMEIKTSSFYNSFQSKESLFFEALSYYRMHFGRVRLNFLNDPEVPGEEALKRYFDHLVLREGDKTFPPGCFMMKTAVNLTDPESRVGLEVLNAISNLEKGFASALQRGVKSREFVKELDIKKWSRLFVAAAYGVSVLTRTKKSKKELLSTALTLIEALPRPK